MLAWQPIFGSCLRVDYEGTLGLTMEEVASHLDYIDERRRAEWKAAFKRSS